MILKAGGVEVKVEGKFLRIGRLEGETYKFASDPNVVLDDLRRSRRRVDLFTFVQSLSEPPVSYPYVMEMDNLAVLQLSTFDQWWTEQLGFKGRNKAKQAAKKGVSLREVPFDDAFVRGIRDIYNETPIRQGRRFPHYGKTLETVRREAATFLDSSIFIGAFMGEKLIGFAKLTADDAGTQAGLMHIVSMLEHRDKAPTNALVAEAVRACAERKIPYLVYSSFAYGKKQQDSLSDFKERNGFKKFDVPRYFVPLTLLGRAALRAGLHHTRLVDYVPERAIARLRALRSAWYRRKFNTQTESA